MGSEFGRRVYSPIESSSRLRPLVDMISLGFISRVHRREDDDADNPAYWKDQGRGQREQFVRILPEEIKDMMPDGATKLFRILYSIIKVIHTFLCESIRK